MAFAAVQTLSEPNPQPGGEALYARLERHREVEAAHYLNQWLRPPR